MFPGLFMIYWIRRKALSLFVVQLRCAVSCKWNVSCCLIPTGRLVIDARKGYISSIYRLSDRKGQNIHTCQMFEFESDLYRGIMLARCYPFDAQQYRFRGYNVKVHCMSHCFCLYLLSSNTSYIPCIYHVNTMYIHST